jgi:TRAP-type C4-dicarboxylate transport system permease large subunit
VLPFLVPLVAVLLLITFVPELVTWLPNLVLGPDTPILSK